VTWLSVGAAGSDELIRVVAPSMNLVADRRLATICWRVRPVNIVRPVSSLNLPRAPLQTDRARRHDTEMRVGRDEDCRRGQPQAGAQSCSHLVSTETEVSTSSAIANTRDAFSSLTAVAAVESAVGMESEARRVEGAARG
jgi:hypothetical protein